MHVQQMISTHPQVGGDPDNALVRCIEACFECAQTCTSCADACLGETQVQHLAACIRFNLDCADVCVATGAVASRRTGSNEAVLRMMLEACAEACRRCGEECSHHANMHDHCRVCADACRACEDACRRAAATVTPRRQ